MLSPIVSLLRPRPRSMGPPPRLRPRPPGLFGFVDFSDLGLAGWESGVWFCLGCGRCKEHEIVQFFFLSDIFGSVFLKFKVSSTREMVFWGQVEWRCFFLDEN